ncbi:M1 family metallopeptidase [Chitinophaga agrisoli]|uniref:M1 family metallopeptidase n=1 Tax=Chitinophaga agrisoli TaxID=2607653 RepID=A0A5B2VXC8_9BACT|nr:M1 family metallopeptidase [Chitinophaga agrisoli]KAA2242972.1 M1 family metallopeptidase [Chitinophaga agrisoli]
MKNIKKTGALIALLAGGITAGAQTPAKPDTTPHKAAAAPQLNLMELLDILNPPEKYDYKETFANFFYTNNGNTYRAANGEPGPDYWQNRADYQLDAALHEETNEITGTEILTYTNNSPFKLDFLWMQLDQNLFRDDSRGSAIVPVTGSRNAGHEQHFDAGYKIKSVQLIGSTPGAAPQNLQFLINDTRMQVFLDKAVAPKGGVVKLKIVYSFISPDYGSDRMGIMPAKNGKVFTIAQWYPRMCVFDDVYGWNTVPYSGPAEFYLEYGDFDIHITAPAKDMVVCSGELLNPQEVFTPQQQQRWAQAAKSDETVMIRTAEEVTDPASRPAGKKELTWHFRIKNSRDASWGASSSFILDAARLNLPGGKKAMAVSAYAEEGLEIAWDKSTAMIKRSVEYYSSRWYPYPYPAAVNVGGTPMGMEYPGIVFCAGRKVPFANLGFILDHEFGHTWFPMIVGSNERLYGWMDEGFNTFINNQQKAEDTAAIKQMKQQRNASSNGSAYTRYGPITSSPGNMPEGDIGALLYNKPAWGLKLLREQVLGPERFDFAFKTYIKRWAFKHPTPDDFFRTMENAAGENLEWFWRGWFTHTWTLDVAVDTVTYVDNDPAHGALITISNLARMAMPVILEIKTTSGKTERIKLPVEIWQRNNSWTFKYPSTETISSVTYDPDFVLPDSKAENNTWPKKQ